MKLSQYIIRMMLSAVVVGALAGCGSDGGGGGLDNDNPGENDLNIVAAFGDSITQGSECACAPYPARLAGMIGKTVVNTGQGGTRAIDSINRTQDAIDKYHPAFMLIMYGINDVIHGGDRDIIIAAVSDMISICKSNNVVPVIATYPSMILSHEPFNASLIDLNQRIRNLAKFHGIECVDLEKEFGADPGLYETDGLHPNDAGTQIMAMAFADLF